MSNLRRVRLQAASDREHHSKARMVTGANRGRKDLGVMRTPAVVLDGEVVISGRVPAVSELKNILEKRRG
jgi:protein-disulfide isomerase